jgi:chromate transporter
MLYLQILWTFLKIGALSFGGGLGILPVIKSEMIRTGWMTAQEIADIFAISEMTPGPLAVNAATFAGIRAGGAAGGVIATLGVVLPSFLLSLLAARFFFSVRDSRLVSAGMTGIRPAVAGMVGAVAIQTLLLTVMGLEISLPFAGLNGINVDVFSVVVAAAVFALLMKKVSPILLILLSGITGLLWHIITGL